VSKKAIIAILLIACAAGAAYIVHSGKYAILPHKENTNPRIANLHKAPVKVWYSVKPVTVKTLLGSEKETEIIVHFENTGSKRVSFIVDPTFGIYVTDLSGNVYYGKVSNETVILNPGDVKVVAAYFSEKLPQKGWLHVKVTYANVVVEHIGSETATSLSGYKGEESVKMLFED